LRTTLGARLDDLAGVWEKQATFPPALRALYSSFLDLAVSWASDLELQKPIANPLIASSSPELSSRPKSQEDNVIVDPKRKLVYSAHFMITRPIALGFP
jgi:hypothetical protein